MFTTKADIHEPSFTIARNRTLQSQLKIRYHSNATSHLQVANSWVEQCYTWVNCNDSWVTLCLLTCWNLCVLSIHMVYLQVTHAKCLNTWVPYTCKWKCHFSKSWLYDILGRITHLSMLYLYEDITNKSKFDQACKNHRHVSVKTLLILLFFLYHNLLTIYTYYWTKNFYTDTKDNGLSSAIYRSSILQPQLKILAKI